VSNAGIIAKSQETALASASGPAITIMDAVNDPDIFGPWFSNKQSFAAWFCFLKVIFGLPLDSAELEIFQRLTGRKEPAALGYLPSKSGKPAEPKVLQQNTTLQLNIDGRTLAAHQRRQAIIDDFEGRQITPVVLH